MTRIGFIVVNESKENLGIAANLGNEATRKLRVHHGLILEHEDQMVYLLRHLLAEQHARNVIKRETSYSEVRLCPCWACQLIIACRYGIWRLRTGAVLKITWLAARTELLYYLNNNPVETFVEWLSSTVSLDVLLMNLSVQVVGDLNAWWHVQSQMRI
jgi:hypothetical protein